MKVLLVKTSSLGDIIHTLPAISDAAKAIPDIEFDWVVENSFSEIPSWHDSVKNVIPVALRSWRKNIWLATKNKEWQNFYKLLRQQNYDFVIDAQGLLKSAVISKLAHGEKVGLDWQSARESIASVFYQRKINVNFHQHAILRARLLFSQIFNYEFDKENIQYGLNVTQEQRVDPYTIFFHGTSGERKEWPSSHWIELGKKINASGIKVILPAGNPRERDRAEQIASHLQNAEVLPPVKLTHLAALIGSAHNIVAVDTGLGHLSAALNRPTVSLYGPTNPDFIGTLGENQIHLVAQEQKLINISPIQVWQALEKLCI